MLQVFVMYMHAGLLCKNNNFCYVILYAIFLQTWG